MCTQFSCGYGLLHVDTHTISDSITNPPVRSVSIETALARLSILHHYMHIWQKCIYKCLTHGLRHQRALSKSFPSLGFEFGLHNLVPLPHASCGRYSNLSSYIHYSMERTTLHIRIYNEAKIKEE